MTDLVGKSIDRYNILEQLGEGGMATVYKAYDTRLERDVAIKVIRTDEFAPAVLQRVLKRFEREAKALAKLSHPNIVKVYDFGEYEGSPYLVLEYLPSGTLKQRMGKSMPWQEAATLLVPIANALEYAHQHGIIHRDIKPSNILITENSQPMLSDFGVAKLVDIEETMELTSTGVGVGTPEYMAPEQVTSRSVDARADIYALGIVFYEMVTGRKPFTADTPMAVLFKHANDPLPRPKQFAPNLPDGVEKVLLKALAKNPADRYQSMGDFAHALDSLLKGQETKKDRFKLPASKDPKVRSANANGRLPLLVLGSAGVLLIGILMLTTTLKQKSLSSHLNFVATLTPTLPSTSVHTATTLTLIPTLIPATLHGNGGRIAFVSYRDGNSEIYVMNADGSYVTRLTNNPAADYGPSWSPDGKKIAFVSSRNGNDEIYVMNADSSGVTNLTNNSAFDQSPVWSLDGKKIVFNSFRNGPWGSFVMNADGSGVTNLTNNSAYDKGFVLSPDGKKIAFSSFRNGNSEIYLMNADGSGVTRLTNNQATNSGPAWSPDGKKIAFISSLRDGKYRIYVVNADGSGQTNNTDKFSEGTPIWSPDGKHIAFTSNSNGKEEIYVMNADGSGAIRITNSPAENNNPSWSPDGQKIAFTSNRDGNYEIYIMNADGSGQTNLTNNPAIDTAPVWSP